MFVRHLTFPKFFSNSLAPAELLEFECSPHVPFYFVHYYFMTNRFLFASCMTLYSLLTESTEFILIYAFFSSFISSNNLIFLKRALGFAMRLKIPYSGRLPSPYCEKKEPRQHPFALQRKFIIGNLLG